MSRVDKVASAIKEEIGSIIHDELHDPRLGFITVVQVEVTKDLQIAKVYFSVLGTEKQKEDAQAGIESAKGFIRKLVGDRLKLRYTPELIFKLDESAEYSINIFAKIDRIKDELKKSRRGNKKE